VTQVTDRRGSECAGVSTRPFQAVLAISIAPKTYDVDPLVWGKIVRAVRLVVAGETTKSRRRGAMWCAAARLLADVQTQLPLSPSNGVEVLGVQGETRGPAPQQELGGHVNVSRLDLAVEERAGALSKLMQGNGAMVAVELPRLVSDLSVSLVAALRDELPGRRAIVVAARV
jgi:hypothetical protein